MKHLVLVRHGESQLNVVNKKTRVYCGQIDTHLTDYGRQQAVEAGRRLLALPYLRVRRAITSPLQRAHETLSLILSQFDWPIEQLPRSRELLERSHGVFEGRSEEDVFREYPHYRDDPGFSRFMNHFEQCAPEGESLSAVCQRAWPFVSRQMEDDDDLLVVSHYNTIRCVIGRAMGMPSDEILKLRIPNAVPIVLRWGEPAQLVEGLTLESNSMELT
jgi:broad specificity phosphatase PhoE